MKGSAHKIILLITLFTLAFALDLFGSKYTELVIVLGVVYALFLKIKYRRLLGGDND